MLKTSSLLGLTGALALGCAAQDSLTHPESSDLEAGLASPGKADDASSDVTVYGTAIGLRGAAARTLYNLLHDDGAQAATGNGNRALYAPGMGCITNGIATYCELYGAADHGNSSYEALLHGGAASTLFDLIDDGSGSFVSIPWFACEDAGGAVWCGVEASEVAVIEFEGLEDSGDQFVYEGWAVSDGMAVTTGRFTDGPVVTQRVPVSIADDSLYVLTIEPRRGDASAPAATHLIAGDLELGGTTDLVTEHPAALGTDFADAMGDFILATPSSTSTDDEAQGIWFVDPMAGAAALDLPTLPDGWAYEGWVVTADGPISTGRFTDADRADSDAGGPAAGPEMTPPFPGQDFVSPALDLIGTTVVISVEPEPDNAAAPFAIKPLIAPEVGMALAPELQPLDNMNDNRPSAVVTFGH